jgi:hypothetical protein
MALGAGWIGELFLGGGLGREIFPIPSGNGLGRAVQEIRVAVLLAEGLPDTAVASELFISQHTAATTRAGCWRS